MKAYYSRALATLPLVVVLWFVIFQWAPLNFWLMMGVSVGALGLLALWLRRDLFAGERVTGNDVLLGVGSAVGLYGFFWLGNKIARFILPFAGGQVMAIYTIRDQATAMIIGLCVLLVIGPGEEIFWHGLIQRSLGERLGKDRGYWLTVAIYAGVHVISGNFMLVVAAAVAGLFWGWIYRKTDRLIPNIISHALWDLAVMVLFPIR